MLISSAIGAVGARLRVDGLRDRTVDEYIDEAETFVGWFETANGAPPDVSDLTVVNTDRYMLALMDSAKERGRTWAPHTRHHHVAQLRACGRHLAVVCGLPENPLAGSSAGRKAARRSGDALSDDELLRVFDLLRGDNVYDQVTRAIVALGYEDGPGRARSWRWTSLICAW